MADWVEYVLLVWDWESSFPPVYFATLEACDKAASAINANLRYHTAQAACFALK